MSDIRIASRPIAAPAQLVSAPVPARASSVASADRFEAASRRPLAALLPTEPTPPPAAPDGRAWMAAKVEEIRERVAAGEQVRVVFDIDDTLADSRGRTMELAKQYDAARGTSYFENLTLDQVGEDGYMTARRMGLPKDVAKDVQAFWRSKFFDGTQNVHDLPMQEIIDWAKAAKEAGAEVRYLTGRTEEIRPQTLEELQRFGLPDADDAHLFMKPDDGVKTAEYKVQTFSEWVKDGTYNAWFITESRRDLAAIQRGVPEIPCVLLDAPKEKDGEPVDPSTPIYPSQTGPTARPAEALGWDAAEIRKAA